MSVISNARVRDRFLRLAEAHGQEALAEHLALKLGWHEDGEGRRQLPHQYRRGVLVQLGLLKNRHRVLADTIPAPRARQIHVELDFVEAGGQLQREHAAPVAPAHRAPVGPDSEQPDGQQVREITEHRRAIA